MSESRYPAALLAAVLAVLVWSGIAPHDRFTWLLEVAPTMAGLAILIPTRHRFPMTPLVYTLIAIHMIILCVGGKYTYALVPAGNWLRDAWHLSRNHYDRLGHVAQGFVPAMIARELFIRLKVVRTVSWRTFIIVCVCLAISACYELVEWIVALVSGEASDSFLGTQGDLWDTQTDMALAFAGAILALATLPRWHDRQLERLQRAESAR
jgi:putative membrane protein